MTYLFGAIFAIWLIGMGWFGVLIIREDIGLSQNYVEGSNWWKASHCYGLFSWRNWIGYFTRLHPTHLTEAGKQHRARGARLELFGTIWAITGFVVIAYLSSYVWK